MANIKEASCVNPDCKKLFKDNSCRFDKTKTGIKNIRRFCSIKCARKLQSNKNRMALCHPARLHKGKDLCKPCYAHQDGIKRAYKITRIQWFLMFERQKGLCPICRRKLYEPGNENNRRASPVDHDHKTGRVRGLTCNICNRLRIGKNTEETAKRLVEYLGSDFDGRNI